MLVTWKAFWVLKAPLYNLTGHTLSLNQTLHYVVI